MFNSTVWPSTLHFGVLVASQAILKQHCRCHQNVPPSDHHVAAVGILQRLPAMSSRARGSGMESIWRPSLPDNENKRRGSLTLKMKTQLSSNTKYYLESFRRIVLMLLSPNDPGLEKWWWENYVSFVIAFFDRLFLQQQMETTWRRDLEFVDTSERQYPYLLFTELRQLGHCWDYIH